MMGPVHFVSYYYAPLGRADGVNRTHMTRYLAGCGWRLHVLTGSRYRSLFRNFSEDPSLCNAVPADVMVHRFRSEGGWLLQDVMTLLRGSRAVNRTWISDIVDSYTCPDGGIVYAVVPPLDNALAASRLAERHGLPLVLHFVDDFPVVPAGIVARAGLLVAATGTIRDNLVRQYGHGVVQVMENGYAEKADPGPPREPDGTLKIVYAGSFNFNTRPEKLLEGYALLRQRQPDTAGRIRIDLYGPDGFYYRRFMKKLVKRCPGTVYRGYAGYKELLRRLPEYDLGFASAAGDISFCSKAYVYLNAGLPFMAAAAGGGLPDFVAEHDIGSGCGLTADAIAGCLEDIAGQPERTASWRKNVLGIRKNYGMQSRVEQLSGVLENMYSNAGTAALADRKDAAP